MPHTRTLLWASVATVSLLAAFCWRLFPLGIPGELEIPRLTKWDVPAAGAVELAIPILLAVGLAVLMPWALGRVERFGRAGFLATVAAAMALGGALQVSLEIAAPHGLQRWAVLHHGFHYAARVKFKDAGDVLRNHTATIADMPPSHFTANPAGWVLVNRVLLGFFDAHHDAALFTLHFQPPEMAWQLRNMVGNVSAADQAAMTVVAIGSHTISLCVGLPLAWLAWMRFGGRHAAVGVAALANMLPTMALLSPAHDTVYPTFAALAVALAYFDADTRRVWPLATCGAAIGLGMLFSLCFLPVAALCFLAVAFRNGRKIGATANATGAALLGWVAVVAVADMAGYRAWDGWLICLAKNHDFNTHSGCTPWKWAIVNPLEFAAALGLPLVAFIAYRLRERKADAILTAWLTVIAMLDVAGSNLGEVSRLWLFLMPLGAMLAVEWLDYTRRSVRRFVLPAILLLQAATCITLDRELILWWPVLPKQIQSEYLGGKWSEYRRLSDSEIVRRGLLPE